MFKTDDFAELSALHKSLMEAKFNISPMNEEIAGSPIVAGLSNRVYDALCEAQEKKKRGSKTEWQDWRRIRSAGGGYRGFWRMAIVNARRDLLFAGASPEEKRAMTKCFLSPFTCTESEIDEFIAEVAGETEPRTLKRLTGSNDLKGASLMKLEYVNEDTVHMALWLTNKKTCDIFFSGIKKFSVSVSGKMPPMPAELTKFNVSSSGGESFTGTFSLKDAKKAIEISAEKVDYYI